MHYELRLVNKANNCKSDCDRYCILWSLSPLWTVRLVGAAAAFLDDGDFNVVVKFELEGEIEEDVQLESVWVICTVCGGDFSI